jgi:capsular polysaccharide transport system permease protein
MQKADMIDAFGAFPGENERAPTMMSAFLTQVRVIKALMIREAMARYGREGLGFFWLIGEPMILSSGVMLIWSLAGGHGHGDAPMAAMALSGYATLTLMRHVVSRSVHKFRHSTALMFHRQIKFIDALLATTLLESMGVLTSFLISYMILYLFDLVTPIRDPLLMFGAWMLWTWHMFALGLIIACLTEMSDWLEYFVQPVMYFMLPISGTFYLVNWFTPEFRYYLSWSTQVNVNEMFRESFFAADFIMYWDVWYLIWTALGATAIGLFLLDYAKLAVRYE